MIPPESGKISIVSSHTDLYEEFSSLPVRNMTAAAVVTESAAFIQT